MVPILLIFLWVNEHAGQLLAGPNAVWPTQRKFWVGNPADGAAPPMVYDHRVLDCDISNASMPC